jgi:thymidylate kinase
MRIDDDTPEPDALPPIYPSRPPVNLVVSPGLLHPRNLFAFEGIDGAGKSALLDRVIAAHAARGRRTLKLKLGRSDVTAHALERAKWRNANPLTFSLLSWVTIVEQVAEHRDALDGDGLVFFDRYVPTLMVRGILEGLPTDYMHALAAYAPHPTILFLIDCDPAICRDRMIARGRPISYFEGGARIVGGLHQPMAEPNPATRGNADRVAPLLGHLIRMREALAQRAADYETVMVIDNGGNQDSAFETIMEAIDAVDRRGDASRIAGLSRAG